MERLTLLSLMVIAFATMILWSCSNSETTTKNYSNLEEVAPDDWKALSKKRIYFGHQSVGYNILDGVNWILQQQDVADLNIVEVENDLPNAKGYFAHGGIGENLYPDKKIAAFEAFMKANVTKKPDISFFKFCYVDIREDADVDAIFKQYTDAMGRLEKEYPDVRFLHLTVPLRQKPAGLGAFKQWVKGVLGKPRYGIDDNIKRCEFNDMLRKQYGSTGNVFDLAAYESTFPDGSRAGFKNDGKQYFSMVPEYTSDGGHLNETGQKVIAEKLLLFLL